eukprot:gene10713-11860_t
MIPSGYACVDIIAADMYQEIPIKSTERNRRGSSLKIFICGKKCFWRRILQERRTPIIALIVSVIVQNKEEVFGLL